MREIRFRAWDKLNNEFLAGGKPFNLFGEFMIIQGLPIKRLDDIILQQYTGLKDKNGREIYDGDIIDAGHTRNYIVKWALRAPEFQLFVGIKDEFAICRFNDISDYAVIGNVFNNPELLEK